MRWIVITTLAVSLLAAGIWFSQSQPTVVLADARPSATPIASVVASTTLPPPANPPLATPAPGLGTAPTIAVNVVPVTPTSMIVAQSVAQRLNALLQQTVQQAQAEREFLAYWRDIWPLSRQRGAFEQAQTTIELIRQGLLKHGWEAGNPYLALAAQMQNPNALGPILQTYWQSPNAVNQQNWRTMITTLQLIQAGDKVAYLAETQSFCSDLNRLSTLASASCYGSLLNGYSIALQLNNLEDDEAIIALVQQALSQPENITLNLLRAVDQLSLSESAQPLLKVGIVQALARLPLEYLRQEPLVSFVQRVNDSSYQLAKLAPAAQDELLDPLTVNLHEYHRLYLLAATTPGTDITDNWLDRASENGVALMLFGKDMILTAYRNPQQNKLIDDINRYALKLYSHPSVLSAMEDSIRYCQQHGQADPIGLQLMDLVTFQSPGRDSDFNQLYRQLVQCHRYPS